MKTSKFFPPYFKKNNLDKCSLNADFKKCAGVYFIKDENKIIYVGMSRNNLYRTIYRHFEKWKDSQQDRKVYSKYDYKIRIIKTTVLQAPRLEKYLIGKFKPRDNNKYYEPEPYPQKYLDEMDYFTGKELYNEETPF